MRRIFLSVIILTIPLFVFAQGDVKKKAYFFYLDTCPHCHNVDKYFTENGIYDKYDVKKLDASVAANGKFMMDLYEANGYPEDQRGGVPVVAFGKKFFIGDKPIIDNFVKEIEAADDTNQFPSPPDDIVVHDGPIASVSSMPEAATTGAGNKKDFSAVIIFALIIIIGGALIYLNRKES